MNEITTAAFLTKGSPGQFRFVLSLYDEALKLKAESKSKKPQEMIKLDQWYQKEFPKKIKARSKDPHIIHEELVLLIKWKLARGKFRPRLKELVTMNSPRVVETESRKAFRALFKKDDLGASIQYLCNLKGIGPATASAIVTAAAPERAAFMADECLAAVPEIEGIDYTLQEYLEMLKHIQQARQRLGADEWTPHQVEMALWTHNIILTFKPMLLQHMPMPNELVPPQEDSLGSTISSDSKEIDTNDSVGADSNGTGTSDYNGYSNGIQQNAAFMTNEDTLDNVVDMNSKLIHSDETSADSTSNQNNNNDLHSLKSASNSTSLDVPISNGEVDSSNDSVETNGVVVSAMKTTASLLDDHPLSNGVVNGDSEDCPQAKKVKLSSD